VNDGKDVNVRNPKVLRCMFCYTNHVHVHNPSTKEKKGLITYYKTHGIIILKKHVDVYHVLIIKKIEGQVNGLIRGFLERQPTNKMFNVLSNAIFNFLFVNHLSKKMTSNKKVFCKILTL
jgi:hypothetical protein